MSEGNDWWLTATTPTGLYLYRFGYDDVDTANERSAVIRAVRAELGFPSDDAIVDPAAPWMLSFAPGVPYRYFIDADLTQPKPGVTFHDVTHASREKATLIQSLNVEE
jgi:hypothetical protein